MPLTDFDVWWCDQVIGSLDTKDRCKRQWVAMDQSGLDCSAITKVMDDTWSAEFARREIAMQELAALGQAFDASTTKHKEGRDLTPPADLAAIKEE